MFESFEDYRAVKHLTLQFPLEKKTLVANWFHNTWSPPIKLLEMDARCSVRCTAAISSNIHVRNTPGIILVWESSHGMHKQVTAKARGLELDKLSISTEVTKKVRVSLTKLTIPWQGQIPPPSAVVFASHHYGSPIGFDFDDNAWLHGYLIRDLDSVGGDTHGHLAFHHIHFVP